MRINKTIDHSNPVENSRYGDLKRVPSETVKVEPKKSIYMKNDSPRGVKRDKSAPKQKPKVKSKNSFLTALSSRKEKGYYSQIDSKWSKLKSK